MEDEMQPLQTCQSPEGPPSGEVFVGVDGCRAGWLAVSLGPAPAPGRAEPWECSLWSSMAELWKGLASRATLVLVDMPMGLPWPGNPARECDTLARKHLGPRRSSVFSPPCREALDARTHEAACAMNRRVLGRGLSIQAYNILPKIRELDDLVRSKPGARERLREAHPELAFLAMGGGPRPANKKTAEGAADRAGLLRGRFAAAPEFFAAAASAFRASQAGRDDAADALALALSARRGGLVSLGGGAQVDLLGIPMAIWYAPWNDERSAADRQKGIK
jgi:predicted RNase H-like nuclease